MTRVHFESVQPITPDDDPSDSARRAAVPLRRAIVFGGLLCAAVLGLAWAQSNTVEPEATLTWAEVKEDARRSQRNVAVFFSRTDCVPCLRMRAETLEDPAIKELLRRGWILHEVDIDASGAAELATELGIDQPPAIVLTAAAGTVLLDMAGQPIRGDGYQDPTALRALLTRSRSGEDQWRSREQGGRLASVTRDSA